ncbi:putative RNA-binding protein with PUA-like domain [Fluviicoccus keumensis]|uniref:Putative RNA-binding protein with PUA-like domain n=1 Tax=Fluviicoccus keumensis TaxID=1435465 RepID=A0A4Q7ZB40_9GAMM|nr:EVE domain-containing protein [Fluviicoccus keumensis]RZU47822.1 putative RNA-binding protein with PUA-like domain [Fluviicoccus keumensis]
MAYWLMKSEPSVFGIDHLIDRKVALWDGVRNYQARNFLRQMQKGDLAFFYHSNCEVPGIVGLMRIAKEGYPDPTQFDPEHKYFDPKSPADNPRWTGVDVEFVEKFSGTLSLADLKTLPELAELALVRKGNRLSLMPVSEEQWQVMLALCQRA